MTEHDHDARNRDDRHLREIIHQARARLPAQGVNEGYVDWVTIARQQAAAATWNLRGILGDGLRLVLDRTGRLLTSSFEELRLAPALALGPPEESEVCWKLPVPEKNYEIVLCARPALDQQFWELRCRVVSESRPELPGITRIGLRGADGAVHTGGPLSNYAGGLVRVPPGDWQIELEVGDDHRVVPLQLGNLPN